MIFLQFPINASNFCAFDLFEAATYDPIFDLCSESAGAFDLCSESTGAH